MTKHKIGGKMYKIFGTYRGETEEVDSFETRKEAAEMLKEYRMAYGYEWILLIKRQKDVNDEGEVK